MVTKRTAPMWHAASSRRLWVSWALAVGLLLAALASVASGASGAGTDGGPTTGIQISSRTYAPTSHHTAVWSRAEALTVWENATNTIPLIPRSGVPMTSDKVYVGDAWALKNLNSEVVTYHGWHVMFSLTDTRRLPYNHPNAGVRIGYYYSRDAKSWIYGGNLFPDGASLGSRMWSGSTFLTGWNDITAVYTAVGHTGAAPDDRDAEQRIAVSKGHIHADNSHVWFTGFWQHEVVLQPDGTMYQTHDQWAANQANETLYAFRDGNLIRDPADGKVYMLFEGNTGGIRLRCTSRDIGRVPPGHKVPSRSTNYRGAIGLAEATSADLTSFTLLPPLLSANCVNQELERPQIVIKYGRYYLFTDTHNSRYAPGVTGPDGLYGFVGPGLRSDYQPLNNSGLVAGNPPDAPYQAYAWDTMPNWMSQSKIMNRPGGEPGGSFAPTLQLSVEGTQTSIAHILDYGYVPATGSEGPQPVGPQPVGPRP
jgi:levansucrase